jgi:hypothetical protein
MYAYYEKSCNVDLCYHVLFYMLNTLNSRKYLMQLIFGDVLVASRGQEIVSVASQGV